MIKVVEDRFCVLQYLKNQEAKSSFALSDASESRFSMGQTVEWATK